MRLEDFGITPAWVTATLIEYAICFIAVCAAGILLWCLFCIGLARIAKRNGEKKEWYAYLPLLRLYTLGRMTPGTEKAKKIFGCLLPCLGIARFVMIVASCTLFLRTAAALIFAAENISGGALTFSQLVTFPVSYLLVAFIITAALLLAYKVIYLCGYYGAVKHIGGGKAALFTVLACLCGELGCILLFVASRESTPKNEAAAEPDETAEAEG